jgi:hypothetical protein
MGTIELAGGSCTILVADGPLAEAQSSAVTQELVLGDPNSRIVGGACIDLVASRNGEVVWHLRASTRDGVYSSVHARSAVCTDALLAVIVGSFVLGVDISSGVVLWQHCSHAWAYFGLYLEQDRSAIIIHGELDILKLSLQGVVLWSAGGRDIFTGPFEIAADAIYATDWNGDIYRIDLQTGTNRIVGHGRPFPHT